MADRAFEAIGTHWRITTSDPLGPDLTDRIDALIDSVDRTWSRFRVDSTVRALAATGGRHPFTGADATLLDFYVELFDLTDGAVTPLVGAALEHLGYGAGYRLTPLPGTPTVPTWHPQQSWDGHVLTVDAGQLYDVGAAGKGWLVDQVSALLLEAGHEHHVVDAGGDLVHRGPDPIRVALEHPADPRRALGVVTVQNAAICGSAINRRAWGPGLHHVVDPATGTSTSDVVATWVVAESAMVADGLSTALFFTEGDTLAERSPRRFHHVRLTRTAVMTHDPAFPGEVFR